MNNINLPGMDGIQRQISIMTVGLPKQAIGTAGSLASLVLFGGILAAACSPEGSSK